MLAVTKHSNKWLAEMLGKDQATISNKREKIDCVPLTLKA